MKKINLISLMLLLILNSTTSGSNLKIKAWGDVNIDYLAWKGGDNIVCLPGFFLKDNNLFIKTKHSNYLSTFFNFNFSFQKNEYIIKEAYIQFKNDSLKIKIGEIYPFYDLESNISSNNKIFMEQCTLKGFEETKLFGLMLNYKSKISNFFYYLLTPELSPLENKTQINKFSFFMRSFICLENDNNILHVGFNYKEIIRNQYDNAKYSYVSITDTPFFLRPYSLSRTHYTSLPNYRVISYEIISILKSLYMQSEITFIKAGWKDFNSELYKSIYFQISYILTGEKHHYNNKKGLIKNPKPVSNNGCLEIAARYSFNDITSKGSLISGVCKTDAKKHTVNLGINWYLNNNIKIQFNYAYESFIYRLIEDKKIHNLGAGIRFSF